MEPPAKRLRLSPRDGFYSGANRVDLAEDQARLESGIPPKAGYTYSSVASAPSRTQQLPTYWRRNLQKRSVPLRRDGGAQVLPRAPEVTVTANVINIGILDGVSMISDTLIPAPTAQTEIALSNVGTLTVPGLAQVTAAPGSGSTTPSPDASTTGSVTASLSSSSSTNGTSDDRTVTVTATSTLLVPLRNGTSNLTSSSHYSTIFTAEGFTTTLYDASSTDNPTGYRFGDISTSSFATFPTTTQGEGSTNTRTSSSEASSTGTNPPGTINLTPQQQQVVGGVVGGVAGVAIVLLGILYLLRWYRQKLKAQGRLPEQMTMRHRQLPSADGHDLIPRTPMAKTARSSVVPVVAIKRSLSKLRSHSAYTITSSQTERSSGQAPDSERSFQRVSGRKIPSVLLTGSNGYDDQAPVSPTSEYSSYRRSREVSRVSSFRESSIPTNPFLDSGAEDHGFTFAPVVGMANSTRSPSRSQLSIQTGGISAFSSNRQSDGTIMIRPSPARTPTTSSPTSSSLRLPMHTPPMMSGDIPEMPPLHSFGNHMSPRKFSDESPSAQRIIFQRSISGISARSSSSVGGRFREEI